MKKIFIIILLLSAQTMFGQNSAALYKYRSDNKGAFGNRTVGILDGNQIRTTFRTDGEVGIWPLSPSMEWPKGVPHNYVDGTCVLVGSEILTAQGPRHSIAAGYREEYDEGPDGTPYGFEPISGYFNPKAKIPAMSTNSASWPGLWPRAIPEIDESWDGNWYGYFGKGVKNADVETFFVMDDHQDKDFYRAPFNYRPLASDSSRGGMGLRVEVRGFQWSHVLAEDIIFWHYDIMNISDKELPNTYFGFLTDIGVGSYDGSGSDHNYGYYDKLLDLAYGWDGVGTSILDGGKLGYVGYAYLESPGNSSDGLDNDEDGLFDETRDNDAGSYIFGPVGTYGPSKSHWEGDEDGDWITYIDLNDNGTWDADENEPLNNDVGTDGIGPFNENYVGPDPDGTEGNGRPDQGEPNFGKTDKDESDQIGLTSLSIYTLPPKDNGPGWPENDESMWDIMSSGEFSTGANDNNILMTFGSGSFPLMVGKRERFSVAIVLGDDLTDLVFNKQTVQSIYNANYNFSKPPLKPKLTAVPGDGKVFLYWDKVSELSRDEFMGLDPDSLGYKKDFEGYLLYRSTDAQFSEVKVITDMNGAPKYWKPIVQFDLIDSISGADPVGINGASFNRGSNTGIQNSYIDNNVINGMTYYYALCAYDMGDPNYGTTGLQPTENTKIITQDVSGVISFIDQNCAVVVPNAPVAGYQSPSIKETYIDGAGVQPYKINILNPAEIKEEAKYELLFHSTPLTSISANYIPVFKTVSYDVIRTFNGAVDTILTNVDSTSFGEDKLGLPFDGLAISIGRDTNRVLIDSLTGWKIGNSNLSFNVTGSGSGSVGANKRYWPGDYEINFIGEKTQPSAGNKAAFPYDAGNIKVNFTIKNTVTGEQVYPLVYDNNKDGVFSVGDDFSITEYEDLNNNGILVWAERRNTWKISYTQINPSIPAVEPAAGDQFVIKTIKPFYEGDKVAFVTKAASINNNLANSQLKNINVVPNPYIGKASWETKSIYSTGHAERKIDFINLPANCTIRIFTLAGALVKTINKDSALNGSVSWNLVSEDGMDVAYGLYVYHVDAPGIGEHIGKFAVIK